ncbi:MAG TPA: hypothetical protein VN408_03380 [Actinoplanes sp.]|nr:hypothetical protein [Actinoplanes sp.]
MSVLILGESDDGCISRVPLVPGEVPVVLTAAVAAHTRLTDHLAEQIGLRLAGSADGVRLIPLGVFDPVLSPAEIAEELADQLGVPVTVPLDMPVLHGDGTPKDVEWITADPDGRVSPAPGWGLPAAPGSHVRVPGGTLPLVLPGGEPRRVVTVHRPPAMTRQPVANGPVGRTPFGGLVALDGFRDVTTGRDLGIGFPVLPRTADEPGPVPVDPSFAALAAPGGHTAMPPPLDLALPPQQEKTRPLPAAPPEAPAAPAPEVRTVPAAPDGAELEPDDLTALRRILATGYDGHARVVARLLSTEPGLRIAALTAPGLSAGLIAVRAYCTGERDTINGYLRGAPAAAADPAVLARGVAYGIRRLPAVFGVTYRVAEPPAGPVQPGMRFLEPGFLDVTLTSAGAVPFEWVIWTASARRTGGLDGTGAVFPAGTTFEVLAAPEQNRLYLAECGPATQDRGQLLQRLRALAGGAGRPAARRHR